jgi:hypothetical protein
MPSETNNSDRALTGNRLGQNKRPLKNRVNPRARPRRSEGGYDRAFRKHGFSLQELMGGRGKGKVSIATYANPDDASQTWTGRRQHSDAKMDASTAKWRLA